MNLRLSKFGGSAAKPLKANGEKISDEALSHISLLSYRHVVPMGTYFVDGYFKDE